MKFFLNVSPLVLSAAFSTLAFAAQPSTAADAGRSFHLPAIHGGHGVFRARRLFSRCAREPDKLERDGDSLPEFFVTAAGICGETDGNPMIALNL
jgi:hypothetical protein